MTVRSEVNRRQHPAVLPTRPIKRVLAATDRSDSAARALEWAAAVAAAFGAELHLSQVVVPEGRPGTRAGAVQASAVHRAAEELEAIARESAGERGHAHVQLDTDPASAILAAAREIRPDLLVLGNRGMSGRKEFLLGNVPNRVSHNARCTVVIVNTVADAPVASATSTFRPVITEPAEGEGGFLTGRAARIGAVMAKHGLSQLFGQPERGRSTRGQARRLRAALEELGPTFCKLGQVLSTRPDLLPQPFIDELSTLQDDVPPLTEKEIVRVMEQELGVPWEDVFEAIDSTPMAAGSLAQVHRARLTGGQRVVVIPEGTGSVKRWVGFLRWLPGRDGAPAGSMVERPQPR